MPKRKCDGCTECCTHVGVEPLDKPPGVPCQHLCATGCAIYSDRPQCCAAFKCAWLSGRIPKAYRPDQCGILFDVMHFGSGTADKTALVAIEARPGAIADNLDLIERLAITGTVVLSAADGRMWGDRDDLTHFRLVLRQAVSGQIPVGFPDGNYRLDAKPDEPLTLTKL